MNFCTLFDRNFLYKGLVLYNSLVEHVQTFRLYVICGDDLTYKILRRMDLPYVTVISLSEFEDDELLTVKPTRTLREYYWTSTPSLVLYLFNRYPHLNYMTYLDADLMFFSSPHPLFEELGNNSVLITPHRFSPKYEHWAVHGIYCVQFLTFRRDGRGLHILNWWRDCCLEWCYARFEDGRFGDQKYLDDWPDRFDGVHVLNHIGGGAAPWNIQQYRVHKNSNVILLNNCGLIFYHFQQFKLYDTGEYDLGKDYRLNPDVIELIYVPYIKALRRAEAQVHKVDSSFNYGYTAKGQGWGVRLQFLIRKIRGTYNVYRCF